MPVLGQKALEATSELALQRIRQQRKSLLLCQLIEVTQGFTPVGRCSRLASQLRGLADRSHVQLSCSCNREGVQCCEKGSDRRLAPVGLQDLVRPVQGRAWQELIADKGERHVLTGGISDVVKTRNGQGQVRRQFRQQADFRA
jgi:hypothetical protein